METLIDELVAGTGAPGGTSPGGGDKSATNDLVVVLIKIFSAIILGFTCRQCGFIVPGNGDTRAVKFFVGNVAFPLLIFNTIATAKLGSIDFGVILACSLAKLVVYWSIWVASFCAYRPSRDRGQRFLTATVFAFFAIAGDDFATGFPVINALYGAGMVVYIAANSLVGSLLMVPMTLVLFEVGRAMQLRDSRSPEHGGEEPGVSKLAQGTAIARNIATNPVIFMTCVGLCFQLFFGQFLVPDPSGLKLRLPEPFASIIDLWTGPFAMLALLSTGLSLTSASLRFWPMVLVLLKLVVCAYLSYALGLVFIYQEPKKQLHDFTFFYGSIPTSSAPLVFASAFDPSVQELIASGVLFGYILAGPNMFVTALFLSQESVDHTPTLDMVQSTAGLLSAICAGAFLLFFVLTRRSWTWSGGLLAIYAACVLLYGVVDYGLAHECKHRDMDVEIIAFNCLQKMCTLLVLYFQVVLATDWHVRWHKQWQAWAALISAAVVLAFLPHPAALDQLCNLSPSPAVRVSAVIWSVVLFATIMGLTLWTVRRVSGGSRRVGDAQAPPESGAPRHPMGVFKALCVAQGLRSLMQVVNSADFLMHGDGVFGGRVQLLIIEQTLEVGQGILLLVAVVLEECNGARLSMMVDCFRCCAPAAGAVGSRGARPNVAAVMPELSFMQALASDYEAESEDRSTFERTVASG